MQVVIVPIVNDSKILKNAESLKKEIEKTASVEIDLTDKSPGEKFNYWEMKGVPLRIDLGLKDLESKKLTVFRRDLDKKEVINEKDLMKYIEKVSKESGENLKKQADHVFKSRVKEASSLNDVKKIIDNGGIVRCGFCSVGKEGVKCAEKVEKETGAKVRGTMLEKEKASGKCVVCGDKASHIVYIARDY